MGKLVRTLVLTLTLVLSFALVVSAADTFKWTPIDSRLFGDEYQPPAGFKSLVGNTKEIVAYNWGDLEFDPATVLNGQTFTKVTGVKINWVGTPDADMMPKLQPIFLAKSPAVDIVPLDETLYVKFAKSGWLEPLDDLWDDATWKHFPASLRKSLTVDGHVYAVPQVGRVINVLYYRPSLLKAAGYTKPPKTWAELDEMAKKLTVDKDGDGTIDVWGFAYRAGGPLDGAQTLATDMMLLGDDETENGKVKFNTPSAVKALERMARLRNVTKCVPPGVTAYSHGEVADLFLAGKLAMCVAPSYLYNRCTEPTSQVKTDLAAAVPPVAFEGGPQANLLNFNGWAVNRFSKNKGAAKIFCDLYRGKTAQLNEFVLEGNDVYNVDAFKDSKAQKIPYYDIIDEAVKYGHTFIYENQGEVYKVVIEAMQKALLGQVSPKAALDDAQRQIDRIMKY